MDLNQNGFYSSHYTTNHYDNEKLGDTTLRLDCYNHGGGGGGGGRCNGSFKPNDTNFVPFSNPGVDDGCGLVLGLGPTSMSFTSDKNNNQATNHRSVSCSMLLHQSSNESDSILKLGLCGSGNTSFFSSVEFDHHQHSDFNNANEHVSASQYHLLDEGSTSAKRSGGYMPTLLLAPKMVPSTTFSAHKASTVDQIQKTPLNPGTSQAIFETSTTTTTTSTTSYSMDSSSNPSCGISSSSGNRGHHQVIKRCGYTGCTKGARGATGLCIGHGGGQRCQKPGCNKGSESKTAFCKAHGGGRRCQHLGCTKSAEGKTEYCIAHGGGRRCNHPDGCPKAARGKSGLCIRHGGGKRCKIDGCTRSAEGQAGLCISHGGGRRCQAPDCTKGAQGSTLFCKAHGGGKRCIFAGCTKGAEGSTPLCKGHGGGKRCMFDGGGICPKSVHGGTNFCVAHGGGKRCSVDGCTKSARGRTDFCVRHGGGKRCRVDNCGKSAQGSTDFCKAHGGGKRCSWGGGTSGGSEMVKCEKFARGKSGLCAAHSSLVNGRGRDGRKNRKVSCGGSSNVTGTTTLGPGLFHGLVLAGNSATGGSIAAGHESINVSDCSEDAVVKRPQTVTTTVMMIPPQVLVPPWMKSSNSSAPNDCHRDGGGGNGSNLGIPEGRVHGGGLMSLLGGSLSNVVDGI